MKKKTPDSESIVDKEKLFDKRGKFKEGHPKIGGKEKGSRSFTTKVRNALLKIADGKDYTYEEAFIKSILKKAIIDQDSAIMKLIWNYLDGLPSQSVDITTGGEKITPIYGGTSICQKENIKEQKNNENMLEQ